MKFIKGFVIASILCGLSAVAMAAAPEKIAVVDVQQVVVKSPQTKQIADNIKKQFRKREKKLKADQKRLQASQAKYDKDGAVMSNKDRSKLQDKIISEKSAFQGHVAAFQQDINNAQNKAMQSLLNKIKAQISALAKKKGYTIVLEKRSVAYATNSIDVTNDVIKAMKKAD